MLYPLLCIVAVCVAAGAWFPRIEDRQFSLTVRLYPGPGPRRVRVLAVILAWRRRIGVILAAACIFGLNPFLLESFNTLRWPYLWVRPGLFIVLGFVAVCLWYPALFRGVSSLRLVGAVMIFIGECYLLHSFQVARSDPSPLAFLHLIAIGGTFPVMALSYINQVQPKHNVIAPSLPSALPVVAAVVPTYGEPLAILEKTIRGILDLEYPRHLLRIVVSDDSRRDAVRRLTQSLGVEYNDGPQRDAKAGNLNAALAYLRRYHPEVELVLTQDADELIAPSFLQKIVGYFVEPDIAFVQTPKDAIVPEGDPFGTRDRIFYDTIQPGRNGAGAAISCGSGVMWRIDVLQTVGGFATWNVVEDLTTSYVLHSAGYRSEYHNEHLSLGLAPDDIPGLLKQRGTWAVDTWRLFLFDNPLLKRGLTFRQRLQYMELCLFYVTSAFFTPLLMVVPLLSLATGRYLPIQGSALFPWVVISLLFYAVSSQGGAPFLVRMWQYRVGHWPTFMKAFAIALVSRHKKPRYIVTRKTRRHGFYGYLLWPQFLFLALGCSVMVHAAFNLSRAQLGNEISNMVILAYFLYMTSGICMAAFHGGGGWWRRRPRGRRSAAEPMMVAWSEESGDKCAEAVS